MSSATDAIRLLKNADELAARGHREGAQALLKDARQAFQAQGDPGGVAAVMRREALMLYGKEGIPLLQEALKLARQAQDKIGELESLEDLSRCYSEANQAGAAVAILGQLWKAAGQRQDRPLQARALSLAGRQLCEAWGKERDMVNGLGLLLHASRMQQQFDMDLALMTEDYITGVQYLLSPADFRELELLAGLDIHALADAIFLKISLAHPEVLA